MWGWILLLCLLLLVACWLLTGLLLRSRFRSNWLCSAHAQLRPTFLERLGRRLCAGWSELAPPSLPFTFITGVGAGVPDSWSELSSSGEGEGGGIGTEVRGIQLWSNALELLCARWDSGLQRAQLMCCWSLTNFSSMVSKVRGWAAHT